MKTFKNIRLDEINKPKANGQFNKIATGIVKLHKEIDALSKIDFDLDLHDQIVSMQQNLDKVWDTAAKASKIVKGM